MREVRAVEICAKVFVRIWRPVATREFAVSPKRHHTCATSFTMRSCSACAGDYEDPERTAWTAEENGEAEDSAAPEAAGEATEFPAET